MCQRTWHLIWDYSVSAGMHGEPDLIAHNGQKLTSNSGNYLRRLQAVFALNPERAQSPGEIKYNMPEAAALPTTSVAVSSFARQVHSTTHPNSHLHILRF